MTTPLLQAREADGTIWDDPCGEQLHDLLADMSLSCRFLVVQRLDRNPADQHYMQVFLNDNLSHQMEYREGGPDRHFQAWVPRREGPFATEAVAGVLQDWAADGSDWREALSWVPWSPDQACAYHRPDRPAH